MRFTKNLLIFLAGAAAMHLVTHLMFPYYIHLPLDVGGFSFTSTMNVWTIVASAVVTVALLWSAARIKA